jgi:acetylornithine deacetylase/succinyl-diaminopimelate desuccinylase-like protein
MQISSRGFYGSAIMCRMTRTEKLLAELIALPSVNPAFAQANGATAAQIRACYGEKNVADFLAASAGRAGLDVDFQNVLPGRRNLLARLRPRGEIRQTILLAPHLDTVGADESKFVPRFQRGRIYGRGACDTKGSVAAMFSALCELAAAKHRPAHTEIIFAGLVDEEHLQSGSRALSASQLKAALAIVGEPTRNQVVTAHKGSVWLRVRTRGLSAHAATPHLGRNAVHAMAKIVAAIETDYAAQLRRRRAPLLGSGTVSVGTIAGGTQTNIVPDICEIGVDRRTLPGEDENSERRALAKFLRSRKLTAEVLNEKLLPCPTLNTDARLPLVKSFLRAAQQPRPAGVHYFCDAAVLAAGGIPSVVFGPGDIAQAHTADEWISLAQVERAKDLLVKFFTSQP